jgi:hypothetical protein
MFSQLRKRDKHRCRGSGELTRMANYVKENRLKLQSAGDLIALFHEGKGLEFRAQLTKMLTR